MKRTAFAMLAGLLLAASANVNAWWGGGWNPYDPWDPRFWAEEFFGGGGWGNGWGGGPWGGYGGPWGGYGYPYYGGWGGYPAYGGWGGYPAYGGWGGYPYHGGWGGYPHYASVAKAPAKKAESAK